MKIKPNITSESKFYNSLLRTACMETVKRLMPSAQIRDKIFVQALGLLIKLSPNNEVCSAYSSIIPSVNITRMVQRFMYVLISLLLRSLSRYGRSSV